MFEKRAVILSKEQKIHYFALPSGKKMKAKTSFCFLDIIFSPKELLKFTRTSSFVKKYPVLSKREEFQSEREVYELEKIMASIFKVSEAFIKQGNKVIQVIKGSHTGENVIFWLH